MNNEQLSLLLHAILDGLEEAIDKVRDALPEDAAKTEIASYTRKLEYMSHLIMPVSEDTHIKSITYGDYTALDPLTNFLAVWRERADELRQGE